MPIRSIKRENHEEWLELRKKYIGGADAASVVGLNDFQSPYSLWCEKKGVTPPFEGNLRTEIGTFMEEFIAKKFEQETGKKVRRSNFTFINDSFPWAVADVDRSIVGENAGLECKNTSELNMRHYKNGDYPPRFYAQCVHYMGVCGFDKMYLAVLIGSRDFKIFEIERDEDEIAALMNAESTFYYDYMESDTPPPIDGSDSTREAIQAQQGETPEEEPEPADLSDKKQALDTLMEINATIEQLESQRDAIKNQLIASIGEAWHGNCAGYSISYRPQTRRTFDWKKLQKECPEMPLDGYFKWFINRTLKITKTQEEN